MARWLLSPFYETQPEHLPTSGEIAALEAIDPRAASRGWFWLGKTRMTEAAYDLAGMVFQKALRLAAPDDAMGRFCLRRQIALAAGRANDFENAAPLLADLIDDIRIALDHDLFGCSEGGGWSLLANLHIQRAAHVFALLRLADTRRELMAVNLLMTDWRRFRLLHEDQPDLANWRELYARSLWMRATTITWSLRLDDDTTDVDALLSDAEELTVEIEQFLTDANQAPSRPRNDSLFGLYGMVGDLYLARYEASILRQDRDAADPPAFRQEMREMFLTKAVDFLHLSVEELLPVITETPENMFYAYLQELMILRLNFYQAVTNLDPRDTYDDLLARLDASRAEARTRLDSLNYDLLDAQSEVVRGHMLSGRRRFMADRQPDTELARRAYTRAIAIYERLGAQAPAYLLTAARRGRDWLLDHR